MGLGGGGREGGDSFFYLPRGEENGLLEFDVKGRDENRSESTIKIEIIIKKLGEQMLESSSFVFGSSKCHQFLPQSPKGMSAK
jgi:hypothetical protein